MVLLSSTKQITQVLGKKWVFDDGVMSIVLNRARTMAIDLISN